MRIRLLIISTLVVLLMGNCSKKNDDSANNATHVPILTTDTVTSITPISASCGGLVTSEGSSAVITRGVCWSTGSNPTTFDSHLSAGSGIGIFTCNLAGLTESTFYYVRTYATNSAGTGYGNQVHFTTLASTGTITGTAQFATGISGDLANSIVRIYTSLANWQNNIPIKSKVVSGTGNSVTYSLTGIEPGVYYLDMWKDNDNSGTWSTSDFVGWYGSGGLTNPNLQTIQVTAGSTAECDVTMYVIWFTSVIQNNMRTVIMRERQG